MKNDSSQVYTNIVIVFSLTMIKLDCSFIYNYIKFIPLKKNINEELAISKIPYINQKFCQKTVQMEIENVLDFK